MPKTPAMKAAEERIRKPLEMAMVDLYATAQDWSRVAAFLGVSRQTLYSWRRVLGVGMGDATTVSRGGQVLPVSAAHPCPNRPGRLHCPYCGGCMGPGATACGYCDGDFAPNLSTS